jgi:hypothetical protein
MRAGHFVKQVEGYTAFVPAPLPPEPAVAPRATPQQRLTPHRGPNIEGEISVMATLSLHRRPGFVA